MMMSSRRRPPHCEPKVTEQIRTSRSFSDNHLSSHLLHVDLVEFFQDPGSGEGGPAAPGHGRVRLAASIHRAAEREVDPRPVAAGAAVGRAVPRMSSSDVRPEGRRLLDPVVREVGLVIATLDASLPVEAEEAYYVRVSPLQVLPTRRSDCPAYHLTRKRGPCNSLTSSPRASRSSIDASRASCFGKASRSSLSSDPSAPPTPPAASPTTSRARIASPATRSHRTLPDAFFSPLSSSLSTLAEI